ncbi:hypothetical protein D915_004393 [Fasciola hepatica]|uniref:Uncharacterized protein n=1 Tax=Fasciola hepatica TaxID=6192 RepID=A0A4E0R841_FASHE|nr:hypothetical protein D915_004393 [Fasciola hepatica]
MNPFEKRDKILRTPPGVSFHERSFFNPDRSAQADCSLYDDSGARVLEMPEDLKRYTLTFEDGKTHGPIPSDFRVSFIETDRSTRLIFPLRTSLIENSQLYTSSPLGKTTFPTRTENPTKSPPNVSSELVTKVNVHSASAENTLSPAKQINSPETDSMVTNTVDSSAPVTVRQLRPRQRPQTTNETLPATRRAKRKHADSHISTDSDLSSSSAENLCSVVCSLDSGQHALLFIVYLMSFGITLQQTPETVVAKPRARGRKRQNTPESSETSLDTPITVRRRRPARVLSVRTQSTVSTSVDTSLEAISQTVRRKRSAAVPNRVLRETVNLSHLDATSTTPAPNTRRRGAKETFDNVDIISQDEPIAARLRVRSAHISYMESNLSRYSKE